MPKPLMTMSKAWEIYSNAYPQLCPGSWFPHILFYNLPSFPPASLCQLPTASEPHSPSLFTTPITNSEIYVRVTLWLSRLYYIYFQFKWFHHHISIHTLSASHVQEPWLLPHQVEVEWNHPQPLFSCLYGPPALSIPLSLWATCHFTYTSYSTFPFYCLSVSIKAMIFLWIHFSASYWRLKWVQYFRCTMIWIYLHLTQITCV